ncbi:MULTISPECIES: class I SAM-dependent DNA methyltransferase [Pseudomonas aeruginosa group]|uniref:class I SAM-dependent DNA methyltransferase n=1 Tax=Pseudomonas aeruginosa group TaxID=136841 RepID=UPI001A2EF261|nr:MULTISPECIES: class I SAM-dependent methyltransferase [Pseudomonas aeruginosa group]MBG6886127.1 class I SAM-dependent methyltransferase [Pseudomonas aeruginosa]MCY0315491.1 class I SAM-dependent methyltransferase [Pseudomonas aeruginosa]MDI3610667.1 class I SAM-dependent methyltransferase [Pseudomonas aeruginosa]MDI3677550.1 class I SAM-dependent methyltransferase [Pseudomonas aeruginosa]MDI3707902.1 class I SAM-dependent methyltransferase [Pseudomonas aeruginosa]
MNKSMNDPSFYGETLAPVYDELYGEAAGNAIDTLVELCTGQGPVLELGIGTGRFALPMRERGVDVHGVDASPAMLDKLRLKPGGNAVPTTLADFSTLEGVGGGPFQMAFCTFSSLFLLLSQDDQVNCFQAASGLLKPGGRLVIEAFNPDLSRYGKDQPVYVGGLERNEVLLEASRLEPIAQRISCRFIRLDGQGTQVIPVELRYAWPAELDLMARLAGLRRVHRWAGWDRSPFVAGAFKHISVFEKTFTP